VIRRIGDDRLLVPVSGGAAGENAVFPVNETGLFIWERISAGKTVCETAREIAETFGADYETGRTDCAEYVEGLLKQKLLEVVAL